MKVLVADDDATTRMIVSMSLTKADGFDVICAADGAQAAALAEADPPDLIILDGMMPVLDGPETLLKLRRSDRTKDIPVILLSASSDPDALARFRALWPAAVVAKPFKPAELSALARKIITNLPGRSGESDLL